MLLMISMPWKIVTRTTLNLGDHLCKAKMGCVKGNLVGPNF